jgi:hypothetical protein
MHPLERIHWGMNFWLNDDPHENWSMSFCALFHTAPQ